MIQYKLMEVNSSYSLFLKDLYKDIDKEKSYSELMRLYFDSFYCESNYIENYFLSELNMETDFVIYNNEIAQKKWDENPDKDLFSIFLRQIKAYAPDVLYVTDINMFNVQQLKIIKDSGKKNMKLVCYHFSFITKSVQKSLPFYDLCFTGSIKASKEIFKYNKNVKVVRHAFETTILDKIKIESSVNKPAFIGSIFIGNSFHTNRIDSLCMLKEAKVSFDFYGNIYGSFDSRRQKVLSLFQPSSLMRRRKNTVEYLNQMKNSSKFGLEYYQTIGSYAMNINSHAPIAGTGCGNQRMFEVTGIGSCLVTDYREENPLLFDVDNEIVVYRNNEELVEKLRYLIDNPKECERIAKNGQKKTLNNYTYKHKALQINDYIQELFI